MSEDRKYSLSAWSSEREPLPTRKADEDYSDYFRRLLSEWSFRAKEAEQVHETWRRRLQLCGIRDTDCRQRIFIVLRELMESAFLKNDYIDTGMPKEDREQAIRELEELGFKELCQLEGADWKFALLTRHLRKEGERRVIVDEQMAGFYIDEMHGVITDEAAEAFFRFTTLTRLAYHELDQLNTQRPQRPKTKPALTPKQEAVNDFVGKIISLAKVAYDTYNGKQLSPGVHQPEVTIVIKRDELVNRMNNRVKSDFEELAAICYPPDSKLNARLCQYVRQLQKDDFFGKLPNNLLAELLAPIVKLRVGTVTNYLSQK